MIGGDLAPSAELFRAPGRDPHSFRAMQQFVPPDPASFLHYRNLASS
jgi:hypothetical protein